jgi:Holliday junction resolvase RusA-like endonuclease
VTPEFVVVVRGDPAPQGSKELMRGKGGKPFMVESSKRVDPWRKAIVAACLTEDGAPRMTFTGPVAVGVAFMFRQAKSNEDDYPTGQNVGDVDKLIRAVYDALKMAGVIEDDRYVVDVLPTTKRWSPSASGARITVRSVAAPNPFEVQPRHGGVVFVEDAMYAPSIPWNERHPFEQGGCPEHGIEPCYGTAEWPHH